MLGFFVRRLTLAAGVLLLFSLASFCLFARLQSPNGVPVLTQYWTWLKGVPQGTSLHALTHSSSFRPSVLTSLGHTAVLLGVAILLVVGLSVGLALAAARWRASALDLLLRVTSYLAWAMPAFLLGLVVQQLVSTIGSAHGFGPFPVAGWPGSCPAGIGIDAGTILPCPAAGSGGHYAVNVLRYVTLPALTLAVGFIGLHGRLLRAALLDALDAPYIATARAKGLPERLVIQRHALRVSLPTFVSSLLGDFGVVFGAALAVDWVFQLGGLGSLFIQEFNPNTGAFDLYSMEALVVVTAVLVLASSLLSELALEWLDPRMRAAQ